MILRLLALLGWLAKRYGQVRQPEHSGTGLFQLSGPLPPYQPSETPFDPSANLQFGFQHIDPQTPVGHFHPAPKEAPRG